MSVSDNRASLSPASYLDLELIRGEFPPFLFAVRMRESVLSVLSGERGRLSECGLISTCPEEGRLLLQNSTPPRHDLALLIVRVPDSII